MIGFTPMTGGTAISIRARGLGAFWIDQFHNTDALDGYAVPGGEMLAQTTAGGMTIDAFCAAVGTAGMLVGVRGRCGRVAVRPALSPSNLPPRQC